MIEFIVYEINISFYNFFEFQLKNSLRKYHVCTTICLLRLHIENVNLNNSVNHISNWLRFYPAVKAISASV